MDVKVYAEKVETQSELFLKELGLTEYKVLHRGAWPTTLVAGQSGWVADLHASSAERNDPKSLKSLMRPSIAQAIPMSSNHRFRYPIPLRLSAPHRPENR